MPCRYVLNFLLLDGERVRAVRGLPRPFRIKLNNIIRWKNSTNERTRGGGGGGSIFSNFTIYLQLIIAGIGRIARGARAVPREITRVAAVGLRLTQEYYCYEYYGTRGHRKIGDLRYMRIHTKTYVFSYFYYYTNIWSYLLPMVPRNSTPRVVISQLTGYEPRVVSTAELYRVVLGDCCVGGHALVAVIPARFA